MNITINGQSRSVTSNANLDEIITSYIDDCSRIIAEHNGVIIKKNQWPATPVKDGDKVELVSFVGGG